MSIPMILSPAEPSRLLLTWQAPEEVTSDRTRYAVGEVRKQAQSFTFHYYDDEEFALQNGRSSLQEIYSRGFSGYPAFRLKKRDHENDVLLAFLRRLPPRSRRDFREYCQQFRLASAETISDFTLLAQTEARLPSDGFALVDPLDDKAVQRDFLMEVAGYRQYDKKLIRSVEVGEEVDFQEEQTNPWDPHAIMVLRQGELIGYVGRHRTSAFKPWLIEGRIEAVIAKLNGEVGKPKAYVIVRVSSARSLAA